VDEHSFVQGYFEDLIAERQRSNRLLVRIGDDDHGFVWFSNRAKSEDACHG
jgi:hypothetical protein